MWGGGGGGREGGGVGGGWSGGAKVSCILRHQGIQLILAYSWARSAILEASKIKGGNVFISSVSSLSFLFLAGLGGSVGCAVRLETRRSRVQPPPRSATFFRGD